MEKARDTVEKAKAEETKAKARAKEEVTNPQCVTSSSPKVIAAEVTIASSPTIKMAKAMERAMAMVKEMILEVLLQL